jgi:hypothetical protein
MRSYQYNDLLRYSYAEILRITSVREYFKIIADEAAGRRIRDFLENERAFAESEKSLISRLRYAAHGLRGMLIPNFMPLWNRAIMDGFNVERIEKSGTTYEFIFSPRSKDELKRSGSN